MQLPPVEVVLSWPSPNYKTPKTRGNELLIITLVCLPIALIMVGLRTFTRLRISKSFGIDDIALLFSIPPTIAIAVLTILAVHDWGWDRHIWDVKPELITLGLKLSIAMECLFAMAVSCYKLSLLILTRRIMSSGTGILRHIAAAGIIIVVTEGFVFIVVVTFTCSPVSAYWTLSDVPQKCINEKIHRLIAGVINTSTDLLVFSLSLPILFRLKIPFRQQAILTLLFGAGFALCIAGTVRIFYTWKATSTFDRTWVSYGVWISTMLELYLGIICAAIPACKPFFSLYLPCLLDSNFAHSKPTQEFGTIGKPYSGPSSNTQTQPQFSPYQHTDPHELGKLEAMIIGTRATSNQLLPLSYLDTHSMVGGSSMRKSSNETSLSSLVEGQRSPTLRSKFSTSGQAARERGFQNIDRAGSREGPMR